MRILLLELGRPALSPDPGQEKGKRTMEESQFRAALEEVLEAAEEAGIECESGALGIASVETFRQAGFMTNNEGLVVTLETGEEFELTIVRRR